MKKSAVYLLFTIIFLAIFSCTYHNVYINGEEDNKDGITLLNKFYNHIANKNLDSVDAIVSDSLKLMAGSNGISKMVVFINKKVGDYKSYKIEDHYIRRTTGSTNETSYNYKLKVTYDKGDVDEIVGFIRKDKSTIKLNSYHANSDLLMK
ncbi:MAG TPA: hypothetical protein VNX40_04710 [Mucilaginibacter sp.]|jgi:hypothetical protein|nr:hypothetical protein [Mucilaginibacter sp.]